MTFRKSDKQILVVSMCEVLRKIFDPEKKHPNTQCWRIRYRNIGFSINRKLDILFDKTNMNIYQYEKINLRSMTDFLKQSFEMQEKGKEGENVQGLDEEITLTTTRKT